jgi:tight adherence protein B
MHAQGGPAVTLAVVLACAVLAAGGLAQEAHRLGRRGAVVGRLADGPAPAGERRRWEPMAPPARVAAALVEADLPLAPAVVWTAWVVALGLGPVVAGVAGGPGLAGVALLGLAAGPAVAVRSRRGRAGERLEQALPGALEAVARSLRSGASLRQAVAEAGAAAGTGRVLAAELSRAAAEAAQGASLVAALEGVGRRRPLPGVRLGVAALCLGAETGGAQARAVDGVAATVRECMAVAAELRALSSQARISALVIGLAPVGFGAFAAATDPRTSQFLLHTTGGLILLVTGLVLDGLGWLWMQRLAQVDV